MFFHTLQYNRMMIVLPFLLGSLALGQSWIALYTGTDFDLNAVRFASADTGWAVGNSGIILKTVDGGENWMNQNGGTTRNLHGLSVLSGDEAYIAGDSGLVLKTTDGGITWTPKQVDTEKPLNSVFFTDRQNGYVVGGGRFSYDPPIPINALDTVFRTVDGGESWTGIKVSASALYSIRFFNPDTGFAVGTVSGTGNTLAGIILKTVDLGATWSVQVLDTLPPWGSESPDWVLNNVDFLDNDTGYVVGELVTDAIPPWGMAYLFKTVDGGDTWEWEDPPGENSPALKSISLVSSGGYVTGHSTLQLANGVWFSLDGSVSRRGGTSIHLLDSATGYVVGLGGFAAKLSSSLPIGNTSSALIGNMGPRQIFHGGRFLLFDARPDHGFFDVRGRSLNIKSSPLAERMKNEE